MFAQFNEKLDTEVLSENSKTDVHWIVFAANGERASEANEQLTIKGIKK